MEVQASGADVARNPDLMFGTDFEPYFTTPVDASDLAPEAVAFLQKFDAPAEAFEDDINWQLECLLDDA